VATWLPHLQNLGAEPFSDNERDNFAEFSDLYLCLLSAALDEMRSSVVPQIRERNLAAMSAAGFSSHFLIKD
jgi:hypothetical protein